MGRIPHAAVVKQISTAWLTRRVQYIILFVTARCNLLCKHCFYIEQILNAKNMKELTLEEYERIAQHAGSLMNVSITGGEPFIRKDLAEIVLAFRKYAKTLFFNITTNGLIEKATLETVERIFEKDPATNIRLGVSIDGLENVHDMTRDRQGAFNQTVKTLHELIPLRNRFDGLTLHISTTLTKYNKDQIRELIDFVRYELDVDAHYLGFIRGDAYDPDYKTVTLEDYRQANAYLSSGWISKNPYQNVQNVANRLMRSVNEYMLATDKYFIPCVAGEKMITIDEEGRVKPCEILEQIGVTPYIMGDLRQHNYDIYEVLATKEAQAIRGRILKEHCHCTFECANQSNVAFSLPSLAKAAGLHVIQRLKGGN